jgi:hypothetical protein
MCDRFLMTGGAAVGAWEQTSAGPLDCFVRAFGAVGNMACGGRGSGRAAARKCVWNVEAGDGSAATSSGMRSRQKGSCSPIESGHSNARKRLARTLFFEVMSDFSSFPKPPNKAPEPTPTAVTPRAVEMVIEVKQWICNCDEARGAPAAGVAHL